MGRSVFFMIFSQITIFPVSSRRDGETIAAGINARGFSLILSEHKLKCFLYANILLPVPSWVFGDMHAHLGAFSIVCYSQKNANFQWEKACIDSKGYI